MSPPRPKDSGAPVRGAALALTNLIKLGGLIVAFNELILRPDFRPGAAAVAVFMMTGAQVTESLLIGIIDHFLGRPLPPAHEEEEDG